jgi:hypothetical protein
LKISSKEKRASSSEILPLLVLFRVLQYVIHLHRGHSRTISSRGESQDLGYRDRYAMQIQGLAAMTKDCDNHTDVAASMLITYAGVWETRRNFASLN